MGGHRLLLPRGLADSAGVGPGVKVHHGAVPETSGTGPRGVPTGADGPADSNQAWTGERGGPGEWGVVGDFEWSD